MVKIVFYITMSVFSVFFLSMNNGYCFNKKTLIDQSRLEEIDLIYYDRFPYKKDYNGIKMPECTRAPARQRQKTGDVLLCKEHIALLRPASVIKLWQRQQRLKGYIPFSMKEFGIINVHAYITGVKKYIPVMKNNTEPDSIHVTGKFIRYTREVNHYTIKDKQTNIISVVDATPTHPFYVKNKHKFIPISKVLPSDSLVTLSNHEAYLIHSGSNNFPLKINNKKNKLTCVYNIEIEKKHIYFISKLNILVHNPCKTLVGYYDHLLENDIINTYFLNDNHYMQMEIKREKLDSLILLGQALNSRGRLNPAIVTALKRLGFKAIPEGYAASDIGDIDFSIGDPDDILIWRLCNPMPIKKYERSFLENIPDYDARLQYQEVSSTDPEEVMEDELVKTKRKLNKAKRRHQDMIRKIRELKARPVFGSDLLRWFNKMIEDYDKQLS